MATIRQAGQKRIAQRLLLLVVVSLAGLNGCSHTPTVNNQPHDPLVGNLVPPDLPPPNSAPKTPGAPTSPLSQSPSFQPPGSELTSTNTATLASGSTLGRPLADNSPAGQLTSGSWTRQTPVQPGYNPNPKVEKVPDIEPTTAKLAPSSWQAPPSANSNVQQANTPPTATPTEVLTRQLQDRGVINQKVDQIPEGIHLTCYASRGPSGGLRILEVTAVDYATAARAILQQLDAVR